MKKKWKKSFRLYKGLSFIALWCHYLSHMSILEESESSSSLSCSIIPSSCIFHNHFEAFFRYLWGHSLVKLVFILHLSFVSTIFNMHSGNYFSNSFINLSKFYSYYNKFLCALVIGISSGKSSVVIVFTSNIFFFDFGVLLI